MNGKREGKRFLQGLKPRAPKERSWVEWDRMAGLQCREAEIDSSPRFSQRPTAADREGEAFAGAGGSDLRLGAVYDAADRGRRGVCIRAALAAAGKGCGDYPDADSVCRT